MYHPIEGLACIQERAINTASIVDKVVNSFSEAIQRVHCGALAFKAELVMRSGQVIRPFFSDFFGRANRALCSQFFRARRQNSEPGKKTVVD